MHNKDIFGATVETGDIVVAPLAAPKSGLAVCIVCKITNATILVEPLDRLDNDTYRVKQFQKITNHPALTWEEQLGADIYKRWIEERADLGLEDEKK